MKRKRIYIIIFLILIGGALFSFRKNNEFKPNITLEDIDGVTLQLIDETKTEHGILYNLKLTNISPKLLVQNNVFISYPLKGSTGTSQRQNNFKVEANGNKLNIKTGESINLRVFMPKEVYIDNEFILEDAPWFEVKGYLGKVDIRNQFMSGGDLKWKSYTFP